MLNRSILTATALIVMMLLILPISSQALTGDDELPYFVLPIEPSQKLGSYSNMTNYQSGLVKVNAEYFGSGSTMIGAKFNAVYIPLTKVGNPTGEVIVAIFYGTAPVQIKQELCRIPVSTITTDRAFYECWKQEKYVIKQYDHIGVFYNATNPYGSYIQTYHSKTQAYSSTSFDGNISSRERVSRMSSDEATSWWNTPNWDGYDLSMLLTDEFSETGLYENSCTNWCTQ